MNSSSLYELFLCFIPADDVAREFDSKLEDQVSSIFRSYAQPLSVDEGGPGILNTGRRLTAVGDSEEGGDSGGIQDPAMGVGPATLATYLLLEENNRNTSHSLTLEGMIHCYFHQA